MKPFHLQTFREELEASVEAGKEVHPYPPIYLLGLAWHAEELEKLRRDVCDALMLWPDDVTNDDIIARVGLLREKAFCKPQADPAERQR